MEKLRNVSSLLISQQKEWTEIFSGFETANKYIVTDSEGSSLYYAAEIPKNILLMFLKAARPFEIKLLNPDQSVEMTVKRPFRFYFHELEVFDAQGRIIGSLKRRFSLLRRKIDVYDSAGNLIYELFGPILHPWTFEIRAQMETIGKITKKWSGLAKESFTDADNFAAVFTHQIPPEHKAVLLAATFLIDFMYFENKNND